jgi:hypothetical protein
MFFLQLVGWFVFSCIVMSFVEHQIHSRLMHKRSIERFKRTFEAHAIVHHVHHYSTTFFDEPVAPGEDKEIRLTVRKAPIKALPAALLIALVSWPGAVMLVAVVTLHHWVWNKIHLEMHKPEQKGFSKWRVYKLLARYHWMHHRHSNKNFNVVFPLADYILGTNVRANEAELEEMRQLGFVSKRIDTGSATQTLAGNRKAKCASVALEKD